MRKVLSNFNKIQQGTIFSNAKCLLPFDNSYGILINGSCDIDNEHYQNMLYLPIIPFSEWEQKLVLLKLLKEKYSEIDTKFTNKISATNLSFSTLLLLDEHVIDIIGNTFKKQDDRNLLYKYYILLKYNHLITNKQEINTNLIKELVTHYENDCKGIKKRLIENKYEDYLYLENVDFQEQELGHEDGFVVLLTEVYSIPMKLKFEISNGIDLSKNIEFKEYFGKDDMVLPVSNLDPLYTGYLIQSFKNLFRIGIDRANVTF